MLLNNYCISRETCNCDMLLIMTEKNNFIKLLNKAIKPSPKEPQKSAPKKTVSYTEKQTRSNKTGGAS